MIKQDLLSDYAEMWEQKTRVTLTFELLSAWKMAVSFIELANPGKDTHVGKLHEVWNIQDRQMYDSGVWGGDRCLRDINLSEVDWCHIAIRSLNGEKKKMGENSI